MPPDGDASAATLTARSGDTPRVLHVFSTFATGGPQVRFATLANHFGRRYRHLLVAMDGNYACRERLSSDLDVVFPAVPVTKGDTLGSVRRFRNVLRDLRPDVMVTSNWGSIEWALANWLPVTRHVHIEDGFGPEERSTQLPRRVMMRRFALARSQVVVPSLTLLKIATEIWRLNPRRVRYVPNGIDLAGFASACARGPAARDGSIADRPVIGTVATLRAEKNLGRLLRAFARVTETTPARLVVVGDGAERPGLEALAAELGIAGRTRFTGHVDQPQRLLREFDIFAISSDTEQMPLSVLEAMAASLPVAATDVGDIRAMLAADNGGFVSPCDDGALAASLAALIADPELRRRVGTANRAKAERDYAQETMFDAYAGLFDGRA